MRWLLTYRMSPRLWRVEYTWGPVLRLVGLALVCFLLPWLAWRWSGREGGHKGGAGALVAGKVDGGVRNDACYAGAVATACQALSSYPFHCAQSTQGLLCAATLENGLHIAQASRHAGDARTEQVSTPVESEEAVCAVDVSQDVRHICTWRPAGLQTLAYVPVEASHVLAHVFVMPSG